MRAYIIKRLLLVIPTVFLASLIIFFMIRLLPGSIIDMIVSEAYFITPTQRLAIERQLGLDVPAYIQYGRWVTNIMHGDLGDSLWTQVPVIDEIAARWPVTLQLGIMGLIVAQLIALPIGIFSALRQDTWGDYVGRSLAILCISVPAFWLGTMVIVFPAIWWGYTPSIMLVPFTEDPIGNLKMFIVPAIILGMAMCGMTMRMTRTMMLEAMRRDYIRTAWAKGLRERVVIIRHTLRNALIPVITQQGLWVPFLLGGTIIIETIFVLPGMGLLIVNATRLRDYPVLSGVMLLFGVGMVLINLMVDMAYAYLDPRIRYE